MKRIGLTSVLAVVLGAALIFGGGVFNKAECAKSYKLKFQMAWHTKHPEYKAYKKFVKMVKKETNGRIRFTVFPASQLIGRSEALDGLKNGTIDMLASCGAYYHGMVPEGDVDWLPYISLGHRGEFWDYMNGDNEFHNIVAKNYLEKANAVFLTNVICGSSGIIGRGNNEYATIDSLKNIKLRAAGGVCTRVAKAWGACPVTMATGEVYPALQRGTVDALIFYAYGLKDYKFFEVAKTFTKPAVFTWADDLWINKDSFDKLPKDLQDTLVRIAHKWGRWASTEYWPDYEKENEEWCVKKGVKFLMMDDANIAKSKEMLENVWDWYANESPDCKRLVDLIRVEKKKWK